MANLPARNNSLRVVRSLLLLLAVIASCGVLKVNAARSNSREPNADPAIEERVARLREVITPIEASEAKSRGLKRLAQWFNWNNWPNYWNNWPNFWRNY